MSTASTPVQDAEHAASQAHAVAGTASAPSAQDGPPLPLDQAVEAVGQAARDFGVAPGSPEAGFVTAVMVALREVGRISQASRTAVAELFDKHREAAKDDLTRARELVKAGNVALSQARQAGLTYEVEQGNLVVRMIDKTLPLFIEKMQGVLVLREKQMNRDILWRRYATAGLVTLFLVGGGYGFRVWEDRDVRGALGECLAHPVMANGHVFCDVTRFAGAKP